MSNRITGWVAAVAFVALVGFPLSAAAQAGSQSGQSGSQSDRQGGSQADRQGGQSAQGTTASGELVKVDATAKTLTIKADGRDQQFTFNDQTRITGAQGAAGLATMEGSQVTVMYGQDRTATEIRVTPKK